LPKSPMAEAKTKRIEISGKAKDSKH